MKTKLFYHAPWETGYEVRDEYEFWISQWENSKDIRGFNVVATSKKGNWLRVVYEYRTFNIE